MALNTAIAVGGLAISAYGTNKQAKAASKAANAQDYAAAAQADMTYQQMEMAQDQWEQYKKTYLPLEDRLADRVKNGTADQFTQEFGYGHLSEFDDSMRMDAQQEAANAGAAVAANFQQARQQLASTPGLDPTSQQYLRAANQLNMQEAASTAAAENAARQSAQAMNFQQGVQLKQLNDGINESNYQRDLTGYGITRDNFNLNQQLKTAEDALLLDAVRAGRGIAGTATGAAASALSAQGTALSNATNRANAAQSGLNSSLAGLGTALGTAAGTIGGLFGQSSAVPASSSGYSLGSFDYGLTSASNYNGGGLGLKF